jgi:hypothetical protein
MAVTLMLSSVPLRSRKRRNFGEVDGAHHQLHSLFDSHVKNVTLGLVISHDAKGDIMLSSLNLWRQKNEQCLIIVGIVIAVVLIELVLASPHYQGVRE